jgi:hypothetical protein
MIPLLKFITVLCNALFAGAALHITLIDQPARHKISLKGAVEHWIEMFKGSALYQSIYSVLGLICSTLLITSEGGFKWALTGFILATLLRFTLFILMPVNRILLEPRLLEDISKEDESAKVKANKLLVKWGWLHLVRTLVSCTTLVMFLSFLTDGSK